MSNNDQNDFNGNKHSTELLAIDEYIRLNYVRNKDDTSKLHMFFSPNCVPHGLTFHEVRLCINLFPLRDAQKNSYQKKHGQWITRSDQRKLILQACLFARHFMTGHVPKNIQEVALEIDSKLPPEADVMVQMPVNLPPQLPKELLDPQPITRERFRTGIHKFVEQAIKEISYPSTIHQAKQ